MRLSRNFEIISMAYFVIALVLITTLEISTSEAVKVAAFNIQVFGKTKISKSIVTDTLIKVCTIN